MKKLELVHPAQTQYRSRKSPTRVPSNTKKTSTDRDKEIEDLRNQIKLLKHDTQPKHTENKKKHKTSQAKRHPSGLRLRRPYSN